MNYIIVSYRFIVKTADEASETKSDVLSIGGGLLYCRLGRQRRGLTAQVSRRRSSQRESAIIYQE